jgi:DNA-binding MarR family transcriptional regulator
MSELTNKVLKKLSKLTKNQFLIVIANGKIQNVTGTKTNKKGQSKILEVLKDFPNGLSAGDLGDFLDVRPSSVTGAVSKLEERGFVSRVPDEDDKRIVMIKLTKQGDEALKKVQSDVNDISEEIFTNFTKKEINEFSAYLDRAISNLDDMDYGEFIRKQVNAKVRQKINISSGKIIITEEDD